MNSRRMNRLEELGRVDAEKADTRKGARNLKDEKKRIVRELKADGGSTGSKYITKKKKPSWITKKSDSSSSGQSWIKKKIKKPQYITKKEKPVSYITKKSPQQIREREMVKSSRGYKIGGKVKGVKEDSMRDRMKQPLKKIPKDPNKTRPKTLRPVKSSQKGLKKLPTEVRNKMGYMKKGGRVGMGKAMRGGGCVR